MYKFFSSTFLLGVTSIFSISFDTLAEEVLVYESDQVSIIRGDSASEDLSLSFGDSLSHFLQWDATNDAFVFSDDVDFSNNEIKNVRLENLASAPTCDASVSGKVYYDTVDDIPYSCDGTTWKKLGADIENTEVRQALVGYSGGSVLENGTSAYIFNATSANTGTGRYRITFGAAHPNGSNYNISLSVQADDPNRDNRKIQWLNKQPNFFDVHITNDDNGGTADVYVNEVFDFTVYAEESIVVSQ